MLSKLLVALVLASVRVDAIPTDQHVLPLVEVNGVEDVREALKKAEIIPTVIDDFFPILSLDVEWSEKSSASLGNTLKPKKLQDAPTVTLKVHKASTDICGSKIHFVVTLTDPDAPSRDDPKWSEMCHWIAAGLSVSAELDLKTGKCSAATLTKLDEVMPYKPPGPPEKTGKHRYVFLVFTPANGTTDELHLSKPSDRQHWGGDEEGHGVRDWAKENGLIPVAANFIYAQNKKQ
ncbi:phosphatidylethanolamine-binding protein [Coniochaeta sp. 2T2.1]|nr:phosphatidylethanolamine-binding protein [Coniochaeta sp. 2T2.1]